MLGCSISTLPESYLDPLAQCFAQALVSRLTRFVNHVGDHTRAKARMNHRYDKITFYNLTLLQHLYYSNATHKERETRQTNYTRRALL